MQGLPAALIACLAARPAGAETRLNVMRFTIWGGGAKAGEG